MPPIYQFLVWGKHINSNHSRQRALFHPFPSSPVYHCHITLRRTHGADDIVCSWSISTLNNCSSLWRTESDSSAQETFAYSTDWYKHACVCVKGISVTNQDSQLKYDDQQRAKDRDKEMEERQKMG